ncbi:hypothetical protein AAF712_004830 [Marasmius tenuissimus]|uniref:Uncharacterized protein n=1 Tax=Marasmius tenuissimus TaxID=585030 RepID=A0ABR3A3Q1_9AGAR
MDSLHEGWDLGPGPSSSGKKPSTSQEALPSPSSHKWPCKANALLVLQDVKAAIWWSQAFQSVMVKIIPGANEMLDLDFGLKLIEATLTWEIHTINTLKLTPQRPLVFQLTGKPLTKNMELYQNMIKVIKDTQIECMSMALAAYTSKIICRWCKQHSHTDDTSPPLNVLGYQQTEEQAAPAASQETRNSLPLPSWVTGGC